MLLGGILTDLLAWEWIFYVNIPVALAALAFAPVLLTESRDTRVKSFDALGAFLVTGGLTTLVLGITQGNNWGWSSGRTIGVFVLAAALLVGFVGVGAPGSGTADALRHPADDDGARRRTWRGSSSARPCSPCS